jgi:hypothetical protein
VSGLHRTVGLRVDSPGLGFSVERWWAATDTQQESITRLALVMGNPDDAKVVLLNRRAAAEVIEAMIDIYERMDA